jgi:plasmid stability protein
VPSLTIKNIPVPVLQRLRRRALAERRSLTQQALLLLEQGLTAASAPHASRADAVHDQVAAWRRLAGRWESDLSVEDEVREVYRSRTQGRDVEL